MWKTYCLAWVCTQYVHLYISAKIPAFTSNLMLATASKFLFITKRKHMITAIALYEMQRVP